jgi:hypothetical protein
MRVSEETTDSCSDNFPELTIITYCCAFISNLPRILEVCDSIFNPEADNLGMCFLQTV